MKQKKGVTLIALVITIIVLLILAGVSISLVVGDSGVFTQADQATSQTDLSANREALERALVGKQGEFTTQWDGDNSVTYYDWLVEAVNAAVTKTTAAENQDANAIKKVLVEDGYVITLGVKATLDNESGHYKDGIIGTIQKATKGSTVNAMDGATKYIFELGNENNEFLGIDIYGVEASKATNFFGDGKPGGNVTGTDVEELDNEVVDW